MTSIRKFLSLLILGLAVFSFGASAADAPKKPSGTVSINETQFALIIGGSTGGGVLTYQGKKYPFKIGGMSLGANVGASKLAATGEVYDLTDVSKFPGTMMLKRCWKDDGTMLDRCWNDAGTMLEQCCDDAGTRLERCWDDAGTMLERCWDDAGTMLGRCWNDAGTMLERCWKDAGPMLA